MMKRREREEERGDRDTGKIVSEREREVQKREGKNSKKEKRRGVKLKL